jgi:hypothetical protein
MHQAYRYVSSCTAPHTPDESQRHPQNRDVTEDTLERLIQDVTHLVLKVLGRDEGVKQVTPEQALERDDLSASSSDRRVDVEGFPEVVDTVRAGLGTDVEQDTDVGTKGCAKGTGADFSKET